MKDIERLLFVIGLYDFSTPDNKEKKFFELVNKEIPNRIEEIFMHPKSFAQTLCYLIYCGEKVSEEMINCCLNPDFLAMAYGANFFNLGREILFIDSYIEIFLKDSYTGNRIDKKKKDYLCNTLIDFTPNKQQQKKLTKSDQILLEIYNCIEEMFDFALIGHPLPHFQRPGEEFLYLSIISYSIARPVSL